MEQLELDMGHNFMNNIGSNIIVPYLSLHIAMERSDEFIIGCGTPSVLSANHSASGGQNCTRLSSNQ